MAEEAKPTENEVTEGEEATPEPTAAAEEAPPAPEAEAIPPATEVEPEPAAEGEKPEPVAEAEKPQPAAEGEKSEPVAEGEEGQPAAEGGKPEPAAEGEESQPQPDSEEKEQPPPAKKETKAPESLTLQGKIDDDAMKQLEQIEKEAQDIAEAITKLKGIIQELLNKPEMTEAEAKELEQRNKELADMMKLFEERTKKIQEIITNANVLDSMPTRVPQAKHEEDVLPRMILMTGIEQDYVPKIVVCDQKNKGIGAKSKECVAGCPGTSPYPYPPSPPRVPSFTKKLIESYELQNQLAANNADLEGIRSRLEDDIKSKDSLLEDLQLKLATLQNDIRMVTTENALLNEKIRRVQQSQMKTKQETCSYKTKKKCPAVLAAKLQEYSDYTRRLEKQLDEMETDFKCVKAEITAAQKERDRLRKNARDIGPPCNTCRR